MSEQYPIRIFLVDDHELTRNSLHQLLGSDPRFRVVAQCDNGLDAIEQALDLVPDIILMDINMTPVNGFQATKRITAAMPSSRIIGISAHNHPRYASTIMALGAKGFVTKTSAFSELVHAIIEVYGGKEYICQEIKQSVSYREKE